MTIPSEIQKTINKSDSGFLIDVAKILETDGWIVEISPYYLDSMTGKSREIDLLATKTIDVLYGKRLGSVTYNLIIECKDVRNAEGTNKNNAVFWFKSAEAMLKEIDGYIQHNFSENRWNYTQMKNLHYSSSSEFAFLFESSDGGNGDGREGGTVFKAITQALHSLIFFRSEQFGRPSASGHNITHDLPVVVYRDESNSVYAVRDVDVRPVADNFFFAVKYSYPHPKKEVPISEFFLVEMVRYDRLQDFLHQVENDMKELKGYISWKADG